MNRGARRAVVFGDDDAHLTFLELLGRTPERFGVQVHAFALLPNHFHLLMTAGPRGLGPALGYVQREYSGWLNRARGWDGPIWKARFRSRRIEDDAYLQHVLAYIHLNPVEARLAPDCDRARWTSHPHYVGTSRPLEWLTTARLRAAFGSVEAYLGYVADVRMGRQPGPPTFHPEALWTPPRRTLPPVPEREGDPPETRTLAAAWSTLEAVTGMGRDALLQRQRGRGAQSHWWLVLWWLPRATGRPAKALADEVGAHPSSFSRAPQRLAELAQQDAQVSAWMAALREELVGGSAG